MPELSDAHMNMTGLGVVKARGGKMKKFGPMLEDMKEEEEEN